MSRRESRVSQGVRQNDALHEFEQFKKKFLLANKHITKLNSSLSNRCQELEALVSTLNSENLRLHATMISLYAELKRERDKSSKLMAEIETTAMHALAKTFSTIRRTFDIAPEKPPPTPRKPTTPPKVRRPDPSSSPHANRLAQAPDFTVIAEEDEGLEPSPSPEPVRRKKPPPHSASASSASSSSRATNPANSAVPSYSGNSNPTYTPAPVPAPGPHAIVASIHVDVREDLLPPGSKKRSISRRQSGLITPAVPPSSTSASASNSLPHYPSSSSAALAASSLSPPRPPSPAFGSPLRLAAGLAETDDRELSPPPDEDIEEQLARAAAARKERRRRARAAAAITSDSGDAAEESAREVFGVGVGRKRRASAEMDDEDGGGVMRGAGLKDVTNALPPSHLSSLPPLEIPSSHARRMSRSPTPDSEDLRSATTRAPMTTPMTTPSFAHPPSRLPTPRSSSPVPPPPAAPAEGRERRARRSVNYTEPKLNTKMRKPDPPPQTQASRRSSTSTTTITTSNNGSRPSSLVPDQDFEPDPPSSMAPTVVAVRRKKSRPKVVEPDEDEAEDSDGAQADAEYMPPRSWAKRGARGGDRDEKRHSSAT